MIPLAGKKSKTAKEALMKYLRSFYKRHRGMAALALLQLRATRTKEVQQ